MTTNDLDQMVISMVTQVVPKLRGRITPDTALLGSGSALDSVEFVTVVTGLEEELGDGLDLSAAFLQASDLPDDQNPFRTVRSLSGHLAGLLKRS